MKRRNFLQKASLSTISVVASASVVACKADLEKNNSSNKVHSTSVKPIVIATWNVPNATAKAWEVLQNLQKSMKNRSRTMKKTHSAKTHTPGLTLC